MEIKLDDEKIKYGVTESVTIKRNFVVVVVNEKHGEGKAARWMKRGIEGMNKHTFLYTMWC